MTPDALDPGPLASTEAQPSGARWTLVFVRHLPHPPEKVWVALTDPEQVRAWAPYDADRNLATLGPAVLSMPDSGAATEAMPALVTIAEEPRVLEFTWGDDVLRWDLTPDGAGTELTLQHTMDDHDWLPRTAAGWHLCLVVADHLMARDPIPRIVGEEARSHGWQDLNDAYAAHLGIDAKGWPEEGPAS